MTPLSRKLDVGQCRGCLEHMLQIDQLKRTIKRQARRISDLEKKLGERARSPNETPFGENTPSSKLPFKTNASDEKRQRKGGAKPGHRGHGRKTPSVAGPAETLPAPCTCPDCGGFMKVEKTDRRHVRDYIPEKVVDHQYLVETSKCKRCGKRVEARVPNVLPRGKYSVPFIVNAASEHYPQGRTQGDVCERFDIGRGAFNYAMQVLAGMLDPCMDRIIRQFVENPVRFADETGYREDGVGKYAWLLSTPSISLFLAGQSRAASVPLERLKPYLPPDDDLFPGVLVVDRYAAYNLLHFQLQYCYAHLKRDAEKLEKKHPDAPEVKSFCRALIRQLSAAMRLRKKTKLTDPQYYAKAARIKASIMRIADSEASHPGIQDFQAVFRKNTHRLYHWARDRRVPADNNYSERSLRPLVIARKLSFGTQSANGSRTRSILMSVLHSLEKQGRDPVARFCEALNLKAEQPDLDLAAFLFPAAKPQAPLRRAPDEGVHAGIPPPGPIPIAPSADLPLAPAG
jgi:transposase